MELKTKEQIANMDIDEKRTYLTELEQYREQLMATKNLREQSSGLKRAAETMMKYNPTGAFDLMDKSAQTDIKRDQLLRNKGMNPEEVRRQLRINADRESRMALDQGLTKAEQSMYRKRANVYLAESEKDDPSLQQAAIDVGMLIRGGKGGGTGGTGDTVDTKKSVREDIDSLRKIAYKGKELDAALLAIKTKLNDASDLTQDEKDALYDEAIQASTKQNAPATDVQKAKKFIEDAVSTLDPKKLYSGIRAVIDQVEGLKTQLKSGVGTAALTINMAPLKQAMGSLSSSEYGLAGSDMAAAFSNVPFVGQTIATVSANKKFNNKSEAVKAINAMIESANKIILRYHPDNMQELTGYEGSPAIFKEAVKQIGSLGPLRKLEPIALYNNQNTEDGLRAGGLVKPNPKDYKDAKSYNKAKAEYRAKGGK